jgi:hypothetical protein
MHTSPPRHKSVRSNISNVLIQTAFFVPENRNIEHNKLTCFRFTGLLEDKFNIPLCGIFIIFLSYMCLDAFCIVTVNISAYFTIQLSTLLFMSYIVQRSIKKWVLINYIMNENIAVLISSHIQELVWRNIKV